MSARRGGFVGDYQALSVGHQADAADHTRARSLVVESGAGQWRDLEKVGAFVK
jgi:hypothetical protein